MLQQDAYRLSADARRQAALHRFFRHQAHRPARVTLRWVATHHSDDPLFRAGVQNLGRTRALLFEECGIQTAVLITPPDITDGLRSQRYKARNPRRAVAFSQLQQR